MRVAYARTGGPVKTEDDPLDPTPAGRDARIDRGDPPPRDGGPAPTGPWGSCSVTAGSTGPGRRWPQAANSGRWCASASSPWSATAAACGRSCTSRTPRGHRRRDRARRPRDLQRLRRRAGRGRRVAAGAGAGVGAPSRGTCRVVGRLVAGEAAIVMMTEIRGASNAKAKRELGWQPGTRAGARGSRRELGR